MLRIVPHTVPRVGRSYEHFPDGFELHLLHKIVNLLFEFVTVVFRSLGVSTVVCEDRVLDEPASEGKGSEGGPCKH